LGHGPALHRIRVVLWHSRLIKRSLTMPPDAQQPAPAPAAEQQPERARKDARRPWHRPVLTEVPLQVTALATGASPDLDGQEL
jgi:hypothetical protein